MSHAGGTPVPQLAWSGLHPASTTPAPAPAPPAVFTALPAAAAGLLLPVSGHVDRHRHQHVLLTEPPPPPPPCAARLYRPTAAPAGRAPPAPGWGYAAPAPQPTEYLLVGPSSVLLLR